MMRAPWIVAVMLVAACSSSSSGSSSFPSQICSKITACNVAVTNCEAVFSAVVLSSDCQQQMLGASCSDLTTTPLPASLEPCFPSCTGTMSCTGAAGVTMSTCNGDGTVTECSNGNSYVYTCSGVCSTESKTYTGTCALTDQGVTSPSGCPSCWCQ